MMNLALPRAAERLVADWARQHRTDTGAREQSLVEHVLVELADPRSDHGELLDDLCQRRWTVGTVAS